MFQTITTSQRPWLRLGVIGAMASAMVLLSCSTAQQQQPKEERQISSKEKVGRGWQDGDTYFAPGEAEADQQPPKGESAKDSCRRKAVFDAKQSIIPAFMSSPKARPSHELKAILSHLLHVIEQGKVVSFSYNPATRRCHVVLRIREEGLRSMVQQAK